REGVPAAEPRRPQSLRRLAGRSLSLHGPRAHGRQGRGAQRLAREATADLPRALERGEGPICFVGALARALNVERLRITPRRRARARSATPILPLAVFTTQA